MQPESLKDDQVAALKVWWLTLDPAQARAARSAARQCNNCVHFLPHKNADHLGRCAASPPSIFGGGDSDWPEVFADARCGKWQDCQLPLTWTSPLSPVELARAFRVLHPAEEVPHG